MNERDSKGRFVKGYSGFNRRHKESSKLKMSKNSKMKGVFGSKHPVLKGGRSINSLGYISIYSSKHPSANKMGYVYEQRLVMEKFLGRYLTKKEIIHHIDRNTRNNKLYNLHLFPNQSKHMKYHRFLERLVRQIL